MILWPTCTVKNHPFSLCCYRELLRFIKLCTKIYGSIEIKHLDHTYFFISKHDEFGINM